MYLHLGQDTVIKTKEILGIFDLDTATVSKNTREYLNRKEKEKNAVTVSYELPKSFIICLDKNCKETVYISQISASTLVKRMESFF